MPVRVIAAGDHARHAHAHKDPPLKLSQEQVASVVTEASQKMSDPNYSAVMVGGFVQSQSQVSNFISAHLSMSFGGAGGDRERHLFHCALVAQCYQRAGGRVRGMLSYEDLDAASTR